MRAGRLLRGSVLTLLAFVLAVPLAASLVSEDAHGVARPVHHAALPGQAAELSDPELLDADDLDAIALAIAAPADTPKVAVAHDVLASDQRELVRLAHVSPRRGPPAA